MWKSTSVLLTSALFHRMSGTTDIPIYKFRFNRKFLFFFLFFWVFNSICPGYSCLIMVWVEGRGTHSAPSVNPDRKMLLIWNLAQSYFVILQKKMVENFFQNCSNMDDDFTNYVHFFEKLCEKCKNMFFFSKNNLMAATKKISMIFFQLLKVKIT